MADGLPPPPPWKSDLFTVGVTGTNGKTTTTRLVAAALGSAHRPVISTTTLGSFLDDELFAAAHTYEGFLALLCAGRERGGRFAALEMTSEALARGFAFMWPCEIAVFTNLSHDHLDAHGSPEHYLASKAQLFLSLPPGGTAVLNGRDPRARCSRRSCPATRGPCATASPGPRWTAPTTAARASRARLKRRRTARSTSRVTSSPWGGKARAFASRSRAHSLLWPMALHASCASAPWARSLPRTRSQRSRPRSPQASRQTAASALAAAAPPPGRFELVSDRPRVVVDYAHTPMRWPGRSRPRAR